MISCCHAQHAVPNDRASSWFAMLSMTAACVSFPRIWKCEKGQQNWPVKGITDEWFWVLRVRRESEGLIRRPRLVLTGWSEIEIVWSISKWRRKSDRYSRHPFIHRVSSSIKTLTIVLDIESLEKDALQFSWRDPQYQTTSFRRAVCDSAFPYPNRQTQLLRQSNFSVWRLSVSHKLPWLDGLDRVWAVQDSVQVIGAPEGNTSN